MTDAETDHRLDVIKHRERLDMLSSLRQFMIVVIVGSTFFLHRPYSEPVRSYILVSGFFVLACIQLYEAIVDRRLSRLPQ